MKPDWTDTRQREHLIAAAPELYEALELLAEAADGCEPRREDPNYPLQALTDRAFAALAKARGETA